MSEEKKEVAVINKNLILRSALHIESKKEDNVYHFYMPVGAPLGQAYDACFEALLKISEMAQQAVANVEKKDDPSTQGSDVTSPKKEEERGK